jgi:signal peptidase I
MSIYIYNSDDDKIIEKPLNTAIATYFFSEKISPGDRIKDNDIYVQEDKIIINVKKAKATRFADTNSMDPFLDKGSNGIEIKPEKPEDIKVGDIISYKSDKYDGIIIHRVIEIKKDNEIYYMAKGDNNQEADDEKIRFNQVQGILIGVIY